MSVRWSEFSLDCKASVHFDLKFDPCQVMTPCSCHAQPMHSLSKMNEFELFGKVRSRGTTFMFNTFSFGAWNLEKFEVEVWKILTYQNFSKCQAICLNIPPCLTFYGSFKWEKCLHKSCISLKYLQNGHQFHVIWIWNDRVMHFWSLEKSLDQWYRSKVTYNVASYHMLKKVELANTPNIKV